MLVLPLPKVRYYQFFSTWVSSFPIWKNVVFFFFSVYGFYILQADMVLFMLCFSPKAIKYVNCLWEHWTLGFASAVQVVKDYQTMNCVSSTQTWIKPLLFHPPLPRLQKEVRCMWSGSRLGLFRIFCLSQSLPILLLSLRQLLIRQTRP